MNIEVLYKFERTLDSAPGIGLVFSFLAGMLMIFSPCVYPLVPVTLSVIGVTTAGSKQRAVVLAGVYVAGICFAYTLLGIVASLLGVLLWKIFINPVAYGLMAGLFVFLGLVLLDVVKINFFLVSPDYKPKATLWSLFLVGMISVLAIVPCNFPFLGAILSLIALKRNVAYGAVALVCFSFGYGMVLLMLGMCASLIKRLPKPDKWFIISKKLAGIFMMGLGIYFVTKLINIVR